MEFAYKRKNNCNNKIYLYYLMPLANTWIIKQKLKIIIYIVGVNFISLL